MVRDLKKDSVNVTLPGGDVEFRALNTKGAEHNLHLTLREDVEDKLKVDHLARLEKFGTGVLITLSKIHQHRWDLLVPNPSKFKKLMDKDWVREGSQLEVEEESHYTDDHADVLVGITAKNVNKMTDKYKTIIANVRYPWCTQCKSQDAAFVNAAKLAKALGKKDQRWKAVAWGVLDAREEKHQGKAWSAVCDNKCEYRVITSKDELLSPNRLKSKSNGPDLLESVRLYLNPAVQIVGKAEEIEELRKANTTCIGQFKSMDDASFKAFQVAAGRMRGELVFAATLGGITDALIKLWPIDQEKPFEYDKLAGDNAVAAGEKLVDWVRPRAIPLLQKYEWSMRATYENLGLPIAKIWIDDKTPKPSLDEGVRATITQLARKYVGKIAIVEQKLSAHGYDLRDYGHMESEYFPFFAIANNMSYDATKYSFEVTPDVAASPEDFWKKNDHVAEVLSGFIDKVLDGSWPEAHETEVPQLNWTSGTVKQVVWRTYAQDIENPPKPLLLEVYGKYRSDNDRKIVQSTNLAKAFEKHTDLVSVAAYNVADNYAPPRDFRRDKYSSDTEWHWVPAMPGDGSPRPAITKLMKPKKDAPYEKVVQFAAAHLGQAVDADEIIKLFEQAMEENPIPTTTIPPSPPADIAGDLGDEMGFGAMPDDSGAAADGEL